MPAPASSTFPHGCQWMEIESDSQPTDRNPNADSTGSTRFILSFSKRIVIIADLSRFPA
jgi:hypothetical protein